MEKEYAIMNAKTSKFMHKILVVDDIPINVMLLKRILEKSNYEVYTAQNGKEALEVMKRENISLVLLDIGMPILDGLGVLDVKKQEISIKNIPVIMVSAFSERNIIEESFQKGAQAYIKKPIDKKELMSQMEKILQIN